MRCFVTVGTTSFDKLIEALNTDSVRRGLVEKCGVTHLVIQYGRGTVKPNTEPSIPGLEVEAFDFKPTLAQDMESADMIISHAGAGSIMEALRLRKPLIVVVNDSLMDNHQVELASAMQEGGYLYFAPNASSLESLLGNVDLGKLKDYPERDTGLFTKLIYDELKL